MQYVYVLLLVIIRYERTLNIETGKKSMKQKFDNMLVISNLLNTYILTLTLVILLLLILLDTYLKLLFVFMHLEA